MAHRSRSRTNGGCRHIPPSVYCSGGVKNNSRKRRSHSIRRRRSRSLRSRRRRSLRGSSGRRSRRHSRRSSRRSKRCRPGIKTKNPFFNYLRVFRRKHCGWPQTQVAMEGAKCWCKLSDEQRQKFYKQACSMRKNREKRHRSRRGHRMRRKRSRSRRKESKRENACPT